MSWYQGKISYQQEQENGSLKTITEVYLIDSLSFTEAEARLTQILEEAGTPNHAVKAITPRKFSDVFADETSDPDLRWWQAKIVYVTIDETRKSGAEKRIVNNVLVQASDIENAHSKLKEEFKGLLIPYEIEALAVTPILEVHPYQAPESTNQPAETESE